MHVYDVSHIYMCRLFQFFSRWKPEASLSLTRITMARLKTASWQVLPFNFSILASGGGREDKRGRGRWVTWRRWGSDARGHHRTGNISNPRCSVKNNKAWIKAEDLKGSSDTRCVNSSDSLRRSSRSKMGRLVEPIFKTDDRR